MAQTHYFWLGCVFGFFRRHQSATTRSEKLKGMQGMRF